MLVMATVGGRLFTFIVRSLVVLVPASLVQVSENNVGSISGVVVNVPFIALAPGQVPLPFVAVQEVALTEVHATLLVLPWVTGLGVADRVMVGAQEPAIGPAIWYQTLVGISLAYA